jgi:hypothetical protein
MDTRNIYINNTLGNTDKNSIDEETLKTVDKFVEPFGVNWIDPVNIESKIADLRAKDDELHAEIETLIKISNATTEIEF